MRAATQAGRSGVPQCGRSSLASIPTVAKGAPPIQSGSLPASGIARHSGAPAMSNPIHLMTTAVAQAVCQGRPGHAHQRLPPALADPTDEDPSGPSADPDMVAGKKAIDDKRWADAIKALSSAALRDTRNADIQNYLGYAHRNVGQMDKAFAHHERALKLNPRHRGDVGDPSDGGQAGAGPGASEGVAGDLPVALRRARRLEAKIDRYQREARKP